MPSRPESLALLLILTLAPFASPMSANASADTPVEVTVLRDAYGVPHIYSDTDAGAFYGLGYATAHDRLFQMNLLVRAVQGRMAEVLGPSRIEDDRYFRILGFWRHAREVVEHLDDEPRALLEAYSDGVNDAVAAQDGHLNPLFAELGIEPEMWSPAHCLATFWRFADLFTSDPLNKASGYYDFLDLVAEVGFEKAIEETLAAVPPGDPDAAVVQVEDVPQDVLDAIYAYAAEMGYGNEALGIPAQGWAAYHPQIHGHATPKFSHAWAVSGGGTTTGEAVLVSDPQLPVTFPNLLYEWHLAGATFNVRGIGVPGSAGLVLGFNEHVAYGLTAAGIDQRDLMRLEMTGRNSYVVDGVEYELERAKEVIHVKGGADVEVIWRRSIWGPVVTDLVDEVRADDQFALYGLPFSETDRDTFEGMLAILRSTGMDEFRKALDGWRVPAANLVAADHEGHVFYTVVGAVPVRSISSPLGGMIAQEGTSLAFEWQDIIPGTFKPWVLDPAAGSVFSANHRAAGDWYPLKLGLGFVGGGDTVRSRRLRELLAGLPSPASPAHVLELTQYDCTNAAKRDMVEILRQAERTGAGLSADASSALQALEDWSAAGGQVLTTSPGVFLAAKIDTMFRPGTTGRDLQQQYGGGETGLNLFLKDQLALIEADPDHQPDAPTVAYLDAALAKAWRAAIAQEGDLTEWPAAYAASPGVHPEPGWFAGDLALGDGVPGVTYAAPPLQCADGQTIWSQSGETYTQFVDFGTPDAGLSLLPPGNTEGPGGFWQTQGADWAAGILKPAPLGADAVADLIVEEVVLTYDGGCGFP